jgi:hypothetical protein
MVAKIIPRLGSDHDGEVLASVAAIRRLLRTEHLDLHDLAVLIDVSSVPERKSPDMHRSAAAEPDVRRSADAKAPQAEQRHWDDLEFAEDYLLEVLPHWSKLREVERGFIKKMVWRYNWRKAINSDEIDKLELISKTVATRMREYKGVEMQPPKLRQIWWPGM